MQLDPNHSVEHWHSWLREEAERVWGVERATRLAPALQRMATAVQRVVRFAPRPETVPHVPGVTISKAAGGHDA